MIWYFTRRKAQQDELEAEHVRAKAALEQSKASLDELAPKRDTIIDLVNRLRTIQQENHYAQRLNAAFGQK